MSGKRSLLTGLAVGALIFAFSGPLAAWKSSEWAITAVAYVAELFSEALSKI